MIHRLARKHLHPFAEKSYPLPNFQSDSDTSYLNFNLNSFSDHSYKFYPKLDDGRVATKYIQILDKLGETPSHLKEENILFAQGSAGAIDLIIRAFCEPQVDSIVVSSPTFLYYSYRATLENVQTIDVPLQGENCDQLDIERLAKQKNGKVLFLCSPNNPVGTVISATQIEEILLKFKGVVVVDEAYIEWTERPSFISRVRNYENLIVLRTFSKIWGLAGVRCGVAIASKSIIDVLRLSQTMFSFPDSTADILLSQMNHSEKLIEDRKQMISLREDFARFLKRLTFVKKVYPGEANFLLVVFENKSKVAAHLRSAKIFVQDTSQQMANTLRISIGTKREMEQLKKTLIEL